MSGRDGFIQDAATALKEKVAIAFESMEVDPKLKPTFMLGLSMGFNAIMDLTEDSAGSKANYRIYPVEYTAVAADQPISYYAYDRGLDRSGATNDLTREIWEQVHS